MENFIKISTDFSRTPGARYRSDGPFSGEDFYIKILKPRFESATKNGSKLTIDLDGTYGYATSFLSEAFYTLASDFTPKIVLENLEIVSKEEPYLIDEIKEYISDADTEA